MDSLIATLVISPSGTRHYLAERRPHGIERTRCGTGVDRYNGWGREGRGLRDCQTCESSVR